MPAGPSLGLVLALPPEHPDLPPLLSLARAHLELGQATYLFCLAEGVQAVPTDALQALRASGLRVTACAYAAERFGVPITDLAVFGGLGLLANLLAGCDRVMCFSPAGRRESASDALTIGEPRRLRVRVVTSPATSALPAEAVRVAASLATLRQFGLTLELTDVCRTNWVDPEIAGRSLAVFLQQGGNLEASSELREELAKWKVGVDAASLMRRPGLAEQAPPFLELAF